MNAVVAPHEHHRAFARLALYALALFFLLTFGPRVVIETYEHVAGSRMRYSIVFPLPTDKEEYRAGEDLHYIVRRLTDFEGELRILYSLEQIGTEEAGVRKVRRWEDGSFERHLTAGYREYEAVYHLPPTLVPGTYEIAFSTEIRWRSYTRRHSSRTKSFRIVAP